MPGAHPSEASGLEDWVVGHRTVEIPIPSSSPKLNGGNPPREGRVVREQAENIEELLPTLPRATEKDVDVVYFIQALGGGPVKIGHTTYDAVERRRKELQTGNPQQLVVRALFSGGLWLEQALHEYFAEHRVQGEWFRMHWMLGRMCPELKL